MGAVQEAADCSRNGSVVYQGRIVDGDGGQVRGQSQIVPGNVTSSDAEGVSSKVRGDDRLAFFFSAGLGIPCCANGPRQMRPSGPRNRCSKARKFETLEVGPTSSSRSASLVSLSIASSAIFFFYKTTCSGRKFGLNI